MKGEGEQLPLRYLSIEEKKISKPLKVISDFKSDHIKQI
jgi:hypothetical protein